VYVRSMAIGLVIAGNNESITARRHPPLSFLRPPYAHCVYTHSGYTSPMSIARAEIDALLPLPPATFHILLALVDQERHGYAIIQDVEARTDGELRLSAGTLYRSVARMVEQGLISEVTKRPAARLDDERRRYYRITPFGTAVAKAEMARLSQLVRLARARGLTPEPT
jgi:DNA-binding PadR family transcriptional regulator